MQTKLLIISGYVLLANFLTLQLMISVQRNMLVKAWVLIVTDLVVSGTQCICTFNCDLPSPVDPIRVRLHQASATRLRYRSK